MTIAVMTGLIIAAAAVIVLFASLRSSAIRPDDRLGIIMLAALMLTVSGAFFRVGELAGERRERAKGCLEEGYELDIAGRTIASGNIDLDLFSVLRIDDEHRVVYIDYTKDSPEWARFE